MSLIRPWLLVVLCGTAGASAQVCDPSVLAEFVIDARPFSPDISGIAVSEDLACVVYREGMYTLDVSDPSAPSFLGEIDGLNLDLPAVQIAGEIAFVAGKSLLAIDVSDPTAPTIIGEGDSEGTTLLGLDLVGDLAFAAGSQGLWAYDVSDPTSIELLGVDVSSIGWGLVVEFDTAYVSGNNALRIYDVSDPASPAFIGGVFVPGSPVDVAYAEGLAYVACQTAGLQIVDVEDPVSPEIIGSVITPHKAWKVVLDGDRAIVSDLLGGVQFIDVSDPSAPSIIGSIPVIADTNVVETVVQGNTAFMAMDDLFAEDAFRGIVTVNVATCLDCVADFNGDGAIDVLDFVAFQLAWQAMDPRADCDSSGVFDMLDFVCFQQLVSAGCD